MQESDSDGQLTGDLLKFYEMIMHERDQRSKLEETNQKLMDELAKLSRPAEISFKKEQTTPSSASKLLSKTVRIDKSKEILRNILNKKKSHC